MRRFTRRSRGRRRGQKSAAAPVSGRLRFGGPALSSGNEDNWPFIYANRIRIDCGDDVNGDAEDDEDEGNDRRRQAGGEHAPDEEKQAGADCVDANGADSHTSVQGSIPGLFLPPAPTR